jgi:hypothetical protein
MANAKKELADAITGFFSVYAPEKRRQKAEKKDEERWQAYFKLQEDASRRAQEQHERNLQVLDARLRMMLKEEADIKRFDEMWEAKWGMPFKVWEAEQKAKEAEFIEEQRRWAREDRPLQRESMESDLAYKRALTAAVGRGGGGGGGGGASASGYGVPKFPGMIDLIGFKDPMSALYLQSSQDDLNRLDDNIATMLRMEPDPTFQEAAHSQWQAQLNDLMERRDEAWQMYQQARNSALGIAPKTDNTAGAEDQREELPPPIQPAWGTDKSKVLDPPKSLWQRVNDIRRSDMGLPPIETPVGPPALTPGEFRPFTGGGTAPTATPGVTYQLRDPNAIDPNDPFAQFFGPLNMR